MWFLIKDFFLVVWYVLFFTITIGGITYIVYYQMSTAGLSVRSVLCLVITVLASFILSIPFFGAWRVRSYVKNLQLKTEEVVGLVIKTVNIEQISPDQDLGLLVVQYFPLLGKYVPSVTVNELLETGHISPAILSEPELFTPGVLSYFFGEILQTVNGFILKTFFWLMAFILVPFFIFYLGIAKENRQALQRHMRMRDFE